jgi:hypothetical protein
MPFAARSEAFLRGGIAHILQALEHSNRTQATLGGDERYYAGFGAALQAVAIAFDVPLDQRPSLTLVVTRREPLALRG